MVERAWFEWFVSLDGRNRLRGQLESVNIDGGQDAVQMSILGMKEYELAVLQHRLVRGTEIWRRLDEYAVRRTELSARFRKTASPGRPNR